MALVQGLVASQLLDAAKVDAHHLLWQQGQLGPQGGQFTTGQHSTDGASAPGPWPRAGIQQLTLMNPPVARQAQAHPPLC